MKIQTYGAVRGWSWAERRLRMSRDVKEEWHSLRQGLQRACRQKELLMRNSHHLENKKPGAESSLSTPPPSPTPGSTLRPECADFGAMPPPRWLNSMRADSSDSFDFNLCLLESSTHTKWWEFGDLKHTQLLLPFHNYCHCGVKQWRTVIENSLPRDAVFWCKIG